MRDLFGRFIATSPIKKRKQTCLTLRAKRLRRRLRLRLLDQQGSSKPSEVNQTRSVPVSIPLEQLDLPFEQNISSNPLYNFEPESYSPDTESFCLRNPSEPED